MGERAICIQYNSRGDAYTQNADVRTSVANVAAPTHDVFVPKFPENQSKIKTILEPPSETADLPDQKLMMNQN